MLYPGERTLLADFKVDQKGTKILLRKGSRGESVNPSLACSLWTTGLVRCLGWEDPLEKGKATHSSILAWRIPWTVWPTGSQSVGHDWATFTHPCTWHHTLLSLYREGASVWCIECRTRGTLPWARRRKEIIRTFRVHLFHLFLRSTDFRTALEAQNYWGDHREGFHVPCTQSSPELISYISLAHVLQLINQCWNTSIVFNYPALRFCLSVSLMASPCGLWAVSSRPGIEPGFWQWTQWALTIGQPENSWNIISN